MNKEKAIEVLNTLVEINNDRIEGYETASNETEEVDLKSLFTNFKQTSLKCKADLESAVQQAGGKPEEGTRTSGKFYRAWMDIKAALTGKDRKAILNSCEYGEDAAVATYDKVLKNDCDELNADHRNMVKEQYRLIKADHDRVRFLRDALVEHA